MSCSPHRKCIQIRPRSDQFQNEFTEESIFTCYSLKLQLQGREEREARKQMTMAMARTSWEPVATREGEGEGGARMKTKKKRNSLTIFIHRTEYILQGSGGRR